ncbi:hypothetical protein EHF33_15050 [Deinococcus psychrotolerans]|uniref:Alpha/beta hydrolase n=1 Tax=Deinococcus psychrotolerans TaxID=2489213 RepID=A0A3G8YIW7_9DEIO|nr:hypothetical protein [Deinococcus psychrotolerans]AZI44217.1 hypothetical protein EHF33_15050 [Deinococcus psychrotolerans]
MWRFTRATAILMGMVTLAVLVFVMVAFPVPRFPQPTGPYQIGTHTYHWVDISRPEPFTANLHDRRELMVQVWYPAEVARDAQTVPYLVHPEAAEVWAARFHVPAFLVTTMAHARTHAVADALPVRGRFPILLNPTGFGGFRDASLFWIENLVSHGYVVVGLDQPGTAAATVFPDGRVIPMLADQPTFERYMPLALSHAAGQSPVMNGVALPGGIIPFLVKDLQFSLSQLELLDQHDTRLAGHLDTARLGVFGMSLGGYISSEACRVDARFHACLTVDAGTTAGVAQSGLYQPIMIISRDASTMREERSRAGGWPENEIAHTVGSQRGSGKLLLAGRNRGAMVAGSLKFRPPVVRRPSSFAAQFSGKIVGR